MADYKGRVLIYGGCGNLGTKCVQFFKSKKFWVSSVDYKSISDADINILVTRDDDLETQSHTVLTMLKSALNDSKLDAVICVAGGWVSGNINTDLFQTSKLMWTKNVQSTIMASNIAAHNLRNGGLLVLTGAASALTETPGMLSYGMAKAAVHQCTKSLANYDSGLPQGSTVLCILPSTLDTVTNRNLMPEADFSKWTPLEFITELLLGWVNGKHLPPNGSLVQLTTDNFNTDITIVDKLYL